MRDFFGCWWKIISKLKKKNTALTLQQSQWKSDKRLYLKIQYSDQV